MQGPYQDYHGRQVFLDHLGRTDYDVVFIVQDTFIVLPIVEQILEIQRNKATPFSTIYYYPFDCSPREEWVRQCVASFDFPVAYTEYAKNESRKYLGPLADRHDVIYHGTNLKDFFYMDDKESVQGVRNAIFGPMANKFIVTNVNRNQGRKDISRNFMILKELRDRGHNDIVFYMHMQETDFGGSIIQMSRNFNLEPGVDWLLPNPQQFSAHMGFPVEMVNHIYNASDVFLTTTHGEGWGLSITEAMSTRTPVVGPRNTSLVEILGENSERGWLVNSGETPTAWIIKENDNERMRPLMNVSEAADAILDIKNNGTGNRVELAYKWATGYDWETVCKHWLEVFRKASTKSQNANKLKGTL
jgi:glycosyltransferase involved in cell wall biosynthesis